MTPPSQDKLTQINAGQVVLLGYFLGTQVFLHGDGVVSPAFDCSIVGNNNTLDTVEVNTNYSRVTGDS